MEPSLSVAIPTHHTLGDTAYEALDCVKNILGYHSFFAQFFADVTSEWIVFGIGVSSMKTVAPQMHIAFASFALNDDVKILEVREEAAGAGEGDLSIIHMEHLKLIIGWIQMSLECVGLLLVAMMLLKLVVN